LLLIKRSFSLLVSYINVVITTQDYDIKQDLHAVKEDSDVMIMMRMTIGDDEDGE